jgi:hypothetical protein
MLSGRPMALLEKGGIALADRWFNPFHSFWLTSSAGVRGSCTSNSDSMPRWISERVAELLRSRAGAPSAKAFHIKQRLPVLLEVARPPTDSRTCIPAIQEHFVRHTSA